MSKPAAVIRQAKQADQLIKDLNARPGEGPAPTAQPVEPAPQDVPPDLPEVNVTAAPAPAAEPVDWEHKYRVLEGKYRAEVPKLISQRDEAVTLLGQTQSLAANLQTQMASQQTQPRQQQQPQRREDSFTLVTPQERSEFGDDLIDVVGRRAREVVGPEVQTLQRELSVIKQQVGTTLQEVAAQKRQLVYDALNARLPNWNAINMSAEFLAWLETADVFSGTSRRQALTDAFNSNDAPRVVAIFEAFAREDADSRSASVRTPRVPVETLVAPGQGRGEAPVAPGSTRGRIWSENEIRDFYDRVRRKRVPEDEYKRVSEEIAVAVQEGRVKPDRTDFHTNQR